MALIDIIFPHQCIFCSKVGEEICKKCLTKIFVSLPQCIVCGKISTNGETHRKCIKIDKKVLSIQGWNIPKRLYIPLNKRKRQGIYSVYKYFLLMLLKKHALELENYKIYPIQDIPIDRYLTSSLHSKSNSNKLCLIGESINNREELLKNILERSSNDTEEILVVYLFSYFLEKDHL